MLNTANEMDDTETLNSKYHDSRWAMIDSWLTAGEAGFKFRLEGAWDTPLHQFPSAP